MKKIFLPLCVVSLALFASSVVAAEPFVLPGYNPNHALGVAKSSAGPKDAKVKALEKAIEVGKAMCKERGLKLGKSTISDKSTIRVIPPNFGKPKKSWQANMTIEINCVK